MPVHSPLSKEPSVVEPFANSPQDEVTIHIDGVQRVATVILTGRVTGTVVARAIEHLQSFPRYRRGMPQLWDAVQADLSRLTRGDFQTIVRAAKGSGSPRRQTRISVLVVKDVDFGVARMFELTEGSDLLPTIHVFRDPATAMAWLVEGEQSAP